MCLQVSPVSVIYWACNWKKSSATRQRFHGTWWWTFSVHIKVGINPSLPAWSAGISKVFSSSLVIPSLNVKEINAENISQPIPASKGGRWVHWSFFCDFDLDPPVSPSTFVRITWSGPRFDGNASVGGSVFRFLTKKKPRAFFRSEGSPFSIDRSQHHLLHIIISNIRRSLIRKMCNRNEDNCWWWGFRVGWQRCPRGETFLVSLYASWAGGTLYMAWVRVVGIATPSSCVTMLCHEWTDSVAQSSFRSLMLINGTWGCVAFRGWH